MDKIFYDGILIFKTKKKDLVVKRLIIFKKIVLTFLAI